MIESGNRDSVVGRRGEISRYQILPRLWINGNPLDPHAALANAQRIMSARITGFEQASGRAPTDFEFYVLWNAPAQIGHPHSVVAARTRRFINLTADAAPLRQNLVSASYALRQPSPVIIGKRNS